MEPLFSTNAEPAWKACHADVYRAMNDLEPSLLHAHDKGRDCARTDEVLENYRRRAYRAERRLIELGEGVPSDEC